MTQTASFLPFLSRRWPYKWCCRLTPYAIKHGVKQDGLLYAHTCTSGSCCTPLQPAFTFGRTKRNENVRFLSDGFVFFWALPPCLCFYAFCECWSESRGRSFLTGVWVLIAHVWALISGPQLPASSLLHASEWGYISLSLWPKTSRSPFFTPSLSSTQPQTNRLTVSWASSPIQTQQGYGT